MKSVRSIAALAILSTLAFTSCKKDYTCTCTTTEAGVVTKTKYDREFRNKYQRTAEENCEKMEAQFNQGQAGVTQCIL